MITPLAMSSVIQVQNELVERDREIDALKRKNVERCRKEMETARTRYFNTDPANTLVAKRLEADWNEKIRIYEESAASYEKERKQNLDTVDERTQRKLMELADDFKSLWNNENVSNEEKKRMLRFLIEVILITQYDDHIHLSIRFKTGSSKELDIERGKKSYETWRTPNEALSLISNGLDNFNTTARIADILNAQGLKSGKGLPYTRELVNSIIKFNNLKPLEERYSEMGYTPQSEIQRLTGLTGKTIKMFRDKGRITNYRIAANTKYWYRLEDFKGFLPS